MKDFFGKQSVITFENVNNKFHLELGENVVISPAEYQQIISRPRVRKIENYLRNLQ